MPKSAPVKTKGKAPAAPPPPTRKQLEAMLVQSSNLCDEANQELTRTRDNFSQAIRLVSQWEAAHAQTCEDYEEKLQNMRYKLDHRDAEIKGLRKALSESDECLRRACFYHHTTAVALQASQRDLGQDAYQPIAQAANQALSQAFGE